MYLKFFNLSAKPFEISPDPKFLWLGEKHKEGLACLKYGILRSKGFMALTGDAGTGKTTLLNVLAQSFADNFIFARIPDPYLQELDFFNFTANAFEMDKRFHGKGDFLTELSIFLNQAHANQKEVILVVDEAQQLAPEVLEDIRLISNIEKPEKKLINILFSGQPNFNEILKNNEALRSRLAIYYRIEPLTETETEAYIIHRLKVAGSTRRIFNSSALQEIYSLSNGTPRQINIICDLSLLHAYSAESIEVDADIVQECSKRALIPADKAEPLVEYMRNQAIVPLNPNRAEPSRGVLHTWYSQINGIKAVLSRHKITNLAPVPLIFLISLIGILFYPNSFFSSISKFKLQLRQTINRYVEPDKNDASYQAQVVNVLSPNQSDPPQADLALELENEIKRNEDLASDLENQATLIADLQKKLEKAGSEIAKLKKYLHINRQATAVLKTQVKEINALKASSDARLEELQTANEALTADLEKLQSVKEQAAVLSDRLTLMDQQLNEANSQAASSETRLAKLQTAHDALVVELEALESLRAEHSELKQALTRKDEMLAQQDRELEEWESKLARLQNSNTQLKGELSAQAARLAGLQKNLTAAADAKITLENQLQTSRQEVELLQTRLKELSVQEASSADKLANLQIAHDALVVELGKLESADNGAAELKNMLAEKERLLTQSKQRQQETAEALALAQKSNAELNAKLTSQTALIVNLQQELGAARAEKSAGEEQLLKSRQETVVLQARIKELETQKASSESQFDYLQTAHTALTADFEELKKTREQIAELEHIIKIKDQIIDQGQQTRKELERKFVQVQNTKDKLAGDLSKQKTQVADLQKNLDEARSARIEVEGQLNENQREMTLLQTRTKELGTQKASASDRLANLQSEHNDLKVKYEKLRDIQDRAIELENALGTRDEKLMQSEQRQRDLETDLSRARNQEDYLRSEITSQAAIIAELRDELETARADQASGEQQLQKSRQETALLQRQLNDLKKIQALRATSPSNNQTQKSSRSTARLRKVEAEAPNPADVIDWVIKKKSE